MKAIILAAGTGLRLRPLTETTPKAMVTIGDKPLIEHTLESLPECVDEIIIVVHHLKEQIIDHLGDTFQDKPIRYVDQPKLNGTGAALHLLKDDLEEKFLVVNGDDLYHQDDLRRLIDLDNGMLVFETKGPAPSTIEADAIGCFLGIRHNPDEDEPILRNTGAYVLTPEFFNYPLEKIKVHGKTEYSLPHTFNHMVDECGLKVIKADFWLPVGTQEELEVANKTV